MTEEELREIEKRANAATAGPWFWSHPADYEGDMEEAFFLASDTGIVMMPDATVNVVSGSLQLKLHFLEDHCDDGTGDDAELIANARTDVPRLCAEVRRLQKLLDERERKKRGWQDERVDHSELSPRTRHALLSAGFETLGVVDATSDELLRSQKGAGQMALDEIRLYIRQRKDQWGAR